MEMYMMAAYHHINQVKNNSRLGVKSNLLEGFYAKPECEQR